VRHQRRIRRQAEIRANLLSTWPHLDRVHLEDGIWLRSDQISIRNHIDQTEGGIISRGRMLRCEEPQDRLRGRWDAWVKRADEEEARWKAAQDPLALLMGGLR
jgi:hypothetical protein